METEERQISSGSKNSYLKDFNRSEGIWLISVILSGKWWIFNPLIPLTKMWMFSERSAVTKYELCFSQTQFFRWLKFEILGYTADEAWWFNCLFWI